MSVTAICLRGVKVVFSSHLLPDLLEGGLGIQIAEQLLLLVPGLLAKTS